MKKLLLASTALVAFATVGSAGAADLPVKAPVAPALICPTCNWTGFYFGVNAGGSIGVDTNAAGLSGFPTGAGFPATGNPFLSSTDKRALPGFLGGAQAGYNWQTGNVVLGVEADWQFTDERSTLNVTGQNLAATLFTNSYSTEEHIKSIGTARARLGWAHDGFLWYVTGGAAWARIDNNTTLTSSLPAVTFASPVSVSFTTDKGGWTVGGGVETCLWNNWSAKLEYLYVDLGTINNTFTTPTTAAGTFAVFTSSDKLQDHIIRVGLNYRFGGPVVARY
jgi:outer membrane immunogenic protein